MRSSISRWTSGERSSSGVTSRARSRSTGSPMVTMSRTLTAPTLPPMRARRRLRLGAELVGADVRLEPALESPLVALRRALRSGAVDRGATSLQRHGPGGPTVLGEIAKERGLVQPVARAVEAARVL